MEPITLHAFHGVTGQHLARLPAASASWSDSINEPGELKAVVFENAKVDIPSVVREWGSIVAALRGTTVLHAGYVKNLDHSLSNGTYKIDAGGGATIFEKRLVVNYLLYSNWTNGTVVVDEDNPAGNWPLTVTGSYSDLISKLVTETKKWGDLPITPATLTGGNKTRTYNSYDLATILSRIEDIGDLENGPEFRFDPVLDSEFKLKFKQVTSVDGGEIVDAHHVWSAIVPNGVSIGDDKRDGTYMCSQCFMTGGREEDTLLVAMAQSSRLTNAGWPLLQIADTSHSTVSVLNTLLAYARGYVARGDRRPLSVPVYVPISMGDVHVGDWATIRVGPGDDDVLEMKVTDVSSSLDSQVLTVDCQERD